MLERNMDIRSECAHRSLIILISGNDPPRANSLDVPYQSLMKEYIARGVSKDE